MITSVALEFAAFFALQIRRDQPQVGTGAEEQRRRIGGPMIMLVIGSRHPPGLRAMPRMLEVKAHPRVYQVMKEAARSTVRAARRTEEGSNRCQPALDSG